MWSIIFLTIGIWLQATPSVQQDGLGACPPAVVNYKDSCNSPCNVKDNSGVCTKSSGNIAICECPNKVVGPKCSKATDNSDRTKNLIAYCSSKFQDAYVCGLYACYPSEISQCPAEVSSSNDCNEDCAVESGATCTRGFNDKGICECPDKYVSDKCVELKDRNGADGRLVQYCDGLNQTAYKCGQYACAPLTDKTTSCPANVRGDPSQCNSDCAAQSGVKCIRGANGFGICECPTKVVSSNCKEEDRISDDYYAPIIQYCETLNQTTYNCKSQYACAPPKDNTNDCPPEIKKDPSKCNFDCAATSGAQCRRGANGYGICECPNMVVTLECSLLTERSGRLGTITNYCDSINQTAYNCKEQYACAPRPTEEQSVILSQTKSCGGFDNVCESACQPGGYSNCSTSLNGETEYCVCKDKTRAFERVSRDSSNSETINCNYAVTEDCKKYCQVKAATKKAYTCLYNYDTIVVGEYFFFKYTLCSCAESFVNQGKLEAEQAIKPNKGKRGKFPVILKQLLAALKKVKAVY